MNRQRLTLTLLLVVLGLAGAYAVRNYPRQQRVAPQEPRATTTAAADSETGVAEPDLMVRLELLEPRDESFADFERNIFRFRPRPRPRPPAPAPPSPPLPEPAPEPESEPPQPSDERAILLERELARFTFLGFLEKGEDKILFLRGDEEVFVVREGDRFGEEGRFRVAEVTPQEMTILQGEEVRPIVVPLVEQAPLVPLSGPRARGPGFPSPSARPPLPPSDVAEDALSQEPALEPPPPGLPWPHNAPGEVPNE